MPGSSGTSACWVYYLPQSNSLYLMNDGQTGALGPVIPGTNATVQNSQCILNGAGSSASGSGTDLVVAMALTFKPSFAGARNVFLYAQDVGWQSAGWSPLGYWIVS
jgi:hypothetical protein